MKYLFWFPKSIINCSTIRYPTSRGLKCKQLGSEIRFVAKYLSGFRIILIKLKLKMAPFAGFSELLQYLQQFVLKIFLVNCMIIFHNFSVGFYCKKSLLSWWGFITIMSSSSLNFMQEIQLQFRKKSSQNFMLEQLH